MIARNARSRSANEDPTFNGRVRYRRYRSAVIRSGRIASLIDPGWLFILAGLVMCAAMILIPAQGDRDDLRQELRAMHRKDALIAARLRAHAEFLDELDREEPQLIRRLAASQLNLIPQGHQPVLLSTAPQRSVVDLIDSTVRVGDAEEGGCPTSRLAELATGPPSLWVLGGSVLCLLVGLVLGPSRESAAADAGRANPKADDVEASIVARQAVPRMTPILADEDPPAEKVTAMAEVTDQPPTPASSLGSLDVRTQTPGETDESEVPAFLRQLRESKVRVQSRSAGRAAGDRPAPSPLAVLTPPVSSIAAPMLADADDGVDVLDEDAIEPELTAIVEERQTHLPEAGPSDDADLDTPAVQAEAIEAETEPEDEIEAEDEQEEVTDGPQDELDEDGEYEYVYEYVDDDEDDSEDPEEPEGDGEEDDEYEYVYEYEYVDEEEEADAEETAEPAAEEPRIDATAEPFPETLFD